MQPHRNPAFLGPRESFVFFPRIRAVGGSHGSYQLLGLHKRAVATQAHCLVTCQLCTEADVCVPSVFAEIEAVH